MTRVSAESMSFAHRSYRRRVHISFWALLLAAGSGACSGEVEQNVVPLASDCRFDMADSSSWPSGADAVIAIEYSSRPRCELFIDTSVVLALSARSELAARLRQIGAVRSDGSFLAWTRTTGELVAIDPRSGVLSLVARPGPGPQEIAGAFSLFPASGSDTVYVSDNGRRWHTLSPDNKIVAERSAALIGFRMYEVCAVTQGGFVTTVNSRPIPKVDYLDAGFRFVREFRHDEISWPESSSSRGKVWCGPGPYAVAIADRKPRDKSLAILLFNPTSADWRLVRVRLPWIEGGAMTTDPDSRTPPPTEIISLHDYGAGKVLLAVRTTDKRWQPGRPDPPSSVSAYDSLFDLRIILIDTQKRLFLGELLIDQLMVELLGSRSDGAGYTIAHSEDSVTVRRIRIAGRPNAEWRQH